MKFKTTYVRYAFQIIFIVILLYLAFGLGEKTFEAYCPFGGVEAIYGLITTNNYTCALGEANLAMFFALIGMVVLAKKSFCSWVCPIGAISEVLNRIGLKIRRGKQLVNPKADLILRLLRYPVLAVVLYYTYKIGDLIFRGYDPFYLLFSGFDHGSLGIWSVILMLVLLIASIFISMPFCRYFCPLGAVQDLLSWLGFVKIYRDKQLCTDCGICDESCPQLITVSEKDKVMHIDCTNCLECIEACPEENCLETRLF